MANKQKKDYLSNQVTLEIDYEIYSIPKGYTLATAITYAREIGYRTTRSGDRRGPVCNMGVCFECSVFLVGKGNVRACMLEAEEGMIVHTSPNFEKMLSVDTAEVKEEIQAYEAEYDVAIIGAGPAGLGAAEELLKADLNVVIIDEQNHAGGQIYRHIPETIMKSVPNELVKRVNSMKNLDWVQGNSVWSILPFQEDGQICTVANHQDSYHINLEGKPMLKARRLIIATGAYDHILPFKGWTKPGVMSAGGLQLFAKTQDFLPGDNIVLAGSHPFILIVAKQILESGGTLKGIAFSQHFPKINELFKYGISGIRRREKSKELFQALQAIKKAKVPVWFHTIPIEAIGTNGVSQIKLGKVDNNGYVVKNSAFTIETDAVGLCYGFIASSELPRQLNCKTYYDEINGGHLAVVDNHMQSSVKNVYIAGELTGVGGAELSEIEGRIAGLAVLEKIGPEVFTKNVGRFRSLLKDRQSWVSFAKMLGKAAKPDFDYIQMLSKEPDTYVCRCEEVSYQQLDTLLKKHPHLTSMNAIKLMSRCGMGLCQGRYCERTLNKMAKELLPDTDFTEDDFSARFPVKPVVINDLINRK